MIYIRISVVEQADIYGQSQYVAITPFKNVSGVLNALKKGVEESIILCKMKISGTR